MSSIGSAIGGLLGGSPNNASFQAQSANIMNPTTIDQANQDYAGSQGGIGQQQALANALAGQHGLQNQSNVFNQQQELANTLANQAVGGGPNPAQAALAQNTAANTANQAALMAGQRGAGANAGLIARQAAMQGGMNQQQSVGQAATLGAQQQIAAQQQLAAQQAAMQGVAANQVGNQTGAIGNLNQYLQNQRGQTLGSINAQNNAAVSNQSNMNSANSAMAQTNANNTANAIGGLVNGGAGAVKMLFASQGGMVGANKKLEQVAQNDRMPLPDHLKGMAQIYHPHLLDVSNFALGGEVENQGSPEDKSPSHVVAPGPNPYSGGSSGGSEKKLAKANSAGGVSQDSNLMTASSGAVVPGKASVKGDSPKNDTVPAMLSAGEIVLPRHITQAPDAPQKAMEFVAALISKKGGSQDEEGDFRNALKEAISKRKSKKGEANGS